MNVGILIITHGNIGAVVLQTAIDVLGVCPLQTSTLSAPTDCDPDWVLKEASMLADRLDTGDGVLAPATLPAACMNNTLFVLYPVLTCRCWCVCSTIPTWTLMNSPTRRSPVAATVC